MSRNRAVTWILAAGLGLSIVPTLSAQPVAQVPLDPVGIPRFKQPLAMLGTDIELVTETAVTLSTCEFQTTILPPGSLSPGSLAPKTWAWGYVRGTECPAVGAIKPNYLGPVIVSVRHTPTEVTYVNKLGTAETTNVLAYKNATDQTLLWADPQNREANDCYVAAKEGGADAPPMGDCAGNYLGEIPAAPHLHGGEVPAMLDGGPDAWWTASGVKGHGFYSKDGGLKNGEAIYRYPNDQEAAPIWFHDHTLGATRLNVYAGIAGAYLITDPVNERTDLPELVPLVLQDRSFDTDGQLLMPNAGINPAHPFWVPEFVGDVAVVNGRAWPFFDVQPKRYQFLILNGSNARAYELSLRHETGRSPDIEMYVIATDGGYLDGPVKITPPQKLVIMPGERYRVIVDFSTHVGESIQLRNRAKTPYPNGGLPGSVDRLMQFRVAAGPAAADRSYNPATAGAKSLRRLNPINRLVNAATGTEANATGTGRPITIHKYRHLTMNEVIADGGPLEILMNNTTYTGEGRALGDFKPITTEWNVTGYSELPNEGETEEWEIINLTADAHPVHPHLVDFQVRNRQNLNVAGYTAAYDRAFPGGAYIPGYGPPLDYNCGNKLLAGPGVVPQATCAFGGNPDYMPFVRGGPIPPLPSEAGWKDTVIAYPGQITRVLVRFAPTDVPNNVASTTAAAAYPFDPNHGHGYVWHCHIVDHEDNEMMRPFSVTPNALAGLRSYVKGVDY